MKREKERKREKRGEKEKVKKKSKKVKGTANKEEKEQREVRRERGDPPGVTALPKPNAHSPFIPCLPSPFPLLPLFSRSCTAGGAPGGLCRVTVTLLGGCPLPPAAPPGYPGWAPGAPE